MGLANGRLYVRHPDLGRVAVLGVCRPTSLPPHFSFANLMGGFNPPQAAQTPRGRQGVPPSRPSNFLRRPAVFFTALRALKLLQSCPEHGEVLQTGPVSDFAVRGFNTLDLTFWISSTAQTFWISFRRPVSPFGKTVLGRYAVSSDSPYSEPTCLAFRPLRGPACLGILSHVSTGTTASLCGAG